MDIDVPPRGLTTSATQLPLPQRARTPLTVVIVSWNTRELTLEALRSFLPAGDLPLEVVVVDNASSDGSADAIECIPGCSGLRNGAPGLRRWRERRLARSDIHSCCC
jgi:hypothetical protein